MDLGQFEIGITKSNKGYVITNIDHEEYISSFYLMTDDHKKKIIDIIVSFVTGKLRKIDYTTMLWTDGDYEEPSSDCYLAIKKHNGLLSNIIIDTDTLIGYIHDPLFDVYRIHIEDNLF